MLCSGSIFLIMLSESRFAKWMRSFERNCIIKWVFSFSSFCWPWDFLPENLKLIDKLQTRLWIIWLLIQISFFKDCFKAFHFKKFWHWLTMVADIFTQPPYHKKRFLWPCCIIKKTVLFTLLLQKYVEKSQKHRIRKWSKTFSR